MSDTDNETARGERKWTIAIQPSENERPRKITKIIGLNGNGFSILAPYHKARKGYVHKMPVDPAVQGTYQIPWDDCVSFTADDRVKLSYHTDGFAQFSGENQGKIISGRDPATGVPKGVGLMTHPLTDPIWSGPSVAVTVWGIGDFDEANGSDDNLLTFRPNDFYYRGCTPSDANAWIVCIYAFPVDVIPPVQMREGNGTIDVSVEPLSGRLLSVVRFKTLHLKREKVFLGVYVNRMITNFPHESGWLINGPGDFDANKKGYVLMGRYPREEVVRSGTPSLDRAETKFE